MISCFVITRFRLQVDSVALKREEREKERRKNSNDPSK